MAHNPESIVDVLLELPASILAWENTAVFFENDIVTYEYAIGYA